MTLHTSLRALLAAFALTCLSAAAIAQPPPLPTGGPTQYFIDQGGQPTGPLTIDQLRPYANSGALTPATLAWTEGMPNWQPVAQLPALATLFQPASAATNQASSATTMQPAQFLLGRWSVRGKLPLGDQGPTDAEMEVTYHADGRFTMQGQYQMQHPAMGVMPISVDVSGRWTVHAQTTPDEIPIFLDAQITMTLPAQLNMPPQSESMAQDDTLRIIDANTVMDSNQLTWRRL